MGCKERRAVLLMGPLSPSFRETSLSQNRRSPNKVCRTCVWKCMRRTIRYF